MAEYKWYERQSPGVKALIQDSISQAQPELDSDIVLTSPNGSKFKLKVNNHGGVHTSRISEDD